MRVNSLSEKYFSLRWDDYVSLFSSRISYLTISIPFFGYLILFNDHVASELDFSRIVGSEGGTLFLSSRIRLVLVYFGLIIGAAAHLVFQISKPYCLRQASSQAAYIEFAAKVFTYRDYLEIHGRIARYGHSTLYGKDADRDWTSFSERIQDPKVAGNGFEKLQGEYANLVRGYAIDNFVYQVTGKRPILLMTLVLLFLGYSLLVVPSTDLFVSIVLSLFW